jgi:ubiquitin-conjugating enzyme E2 Q
VLPNSRYLLVKGVTFDTISNDLTAKNQKTIPLVKLDPAHSITLNNNKIAIPEPSHQIDTLLEARQKEYDEEENDEEDLAVFEHKPAAPEVIEVDDDKDESGFFDEDDDYYVPTPKPAASSKGKGKATGRKAAAVKGDWKHDPEWVNNTIAHLMPPPLEATPSATMAVQRELAAMLKEQENAKSFKELGWYMPPELIGDNLFQWIVEMHSFDETIPIAKDLQQKWVISPLNFRGVDERAGGVGT